MFDKILGRIREDGDGGPIDISGKADKVDTPQIIQCRFLSQLTKEQWDSLKVGDCIIESYGYSFFIVTNVGSKLTAYGSRRMISLFEIPVYVDSLITESGNCWIVEYDEGEEGYSFIARYPVCNVGVSSTIPNNGMLPNKLYNLGELTNDTTFVMNTSVLYFSNLIANVWTWTFSTGSTAPMITWPQQITMWADGEAPTIEANKRYEVSVMDGLACVVSADIPQQQSND